MTTHNATLPKSRLRPVATHRRLAGPRTIVALMLREMSTTYGRSAMGYLWAILEPVAGIVLLTAVFSLALRQPSIGISFPMFYATGLLPFSFALTIAGKVSQSISFSRSLLGYPAVTFVDAIVARVLINGATGLLVGYLVFSALMFFYDTRTEPDVFGIALSYAMALVFGTCLLYTSPSPRD